MAKLFVLSAAAALAVASTAHAQTVVNGGFESLTLANDSYAYTPVGVNGVTFFGRSGLQASSTAWGFGAVPNGNQSAFIQVGGWFDQTVTGLTVGNSYSVLFFDSFRADTRLYAADPYSVSFDGQLLGTFLPTSNAFSAVTTGFFVARATNGILKFRGMPLDGLDRAVGIDAVSVVAVQASTSELTAVPEPATWAMMVVGFGAIGGALRRRATVAPRIRFA